jgi:hypothetical protein
MYRSIAKNHGHGAEKDDLFIRDALSEIFVSVRS